MNLDDIEIRVGRGQYVEQDVQALLAAAKNPDSDVVDRIGKGYRDMIDVAYLFALVAHQNLRPSAAERAAKDAAATAKALADAQAKRDADNAKALAAQAQADADRLAAAEQVAQDQADAVAAQAAVEKFKADQAATDKILAQKHQVSSVLMEQLGNVQTITPVLGPQDQKKN